MPQRVVDKVKDAKKTVSRYLANRRAEDALVGSGAAANAGRQVQGRERDVARILEENGG